MHRAKIKHRARTTQSSGQSSFDQCVQQRSEEAIGSFVVGVLATASSKQDNLNQWQGVHCHEIFPGRMWVRQPVSLPRTLCHQQTGGEGFLCIWFAGRPRNALCILPTNMGEISILHGDVMLLCLVVHIFPGMMILMNYCWPAFSGLEATKRNSIGLYRNSCQNPGWFVIPWVVLKPLIVTNDGNPCQPYRVQREGSGFGTRLMCEK